jgi:site-specific DNA-adenine methylase
MSEHRTRTFGLDIIARNDDDWRMRYPGGKGKCFQNVVNILPAHRTYIETHLGGGAVLRHKAPAERSFGVDLDDEVISFWRQAFPSLATFIHGDAVSFLTNWDYKGDELVYCDPPYLPSTRRQKHVYRCDYTEDDHIRLVGTLRTLPCFVVLSGYPSDLYDGLLHDWSRIQFQAKTQTSVRTECLWFNYQQPEALHDAAYLGKDFRERQVIKRRLTRIQGRLARLPITEKHEVSKWLDQHLAQEGGRHACLLST